MTYQPTINQSAQPSALGPRNQSKREQVISWHRPRRPVPRATTQQFHPAWDAMNLPHIYCMVGRRCFPAESAGLEHDLCGKQRRTTASAVRSRNPYAFAPLGLGAPTEIKA